MNQLFTMATTAGTELPSSQPGVICDPAGQRVLFGNHMSLFRISYASGGQTCTDEDVRMQMSSAACHMSSQLYLCRPCSYSLRL